MALCYSFISTSIVYSILMFRCPFFLKVLEKQRRNVRIKSYTTLILCIKLLPTYNSEHCPRGNMDYFSNHKTYGVTSNCSGTDVAPVLEVNTWGCPLTCWSCGRHKCLDLLLHLNTGSQILQMTYFFPLFPIDTPLKSIN